ncbi:hypothetical protein N806_11290 [Rhodococcus sp. P27]|nr:hypothetical protein N806_11290 [Rhodococcus sp. P27]
MVIAEEALMKMLVTAASRHGSTDEIAGALADALRRSGADVDLLEPEDVHEITDYDTVVIGSAIYTGRWLPPAKEFIARFREALLLRQVWLFSSGPVGNNGRPVNDPPDVSAQVEATAPARTECSPENSIAPPSVSGNG